MKSIKIVTDSTCDLSKEEIEALNIHVVPLTISINGQSYIDGVNVDGRTFFDKMEQSKELPKSSQPAAGEFFELYKKLTEDGSQVLSIHLSGKLSGTAESARTAAKMAGTNITVIDSLFASQALGFQVLKAAELAIAGNNTLEEIITELEQIRSNTHLYLMVDTLKNLEMGGRIGKASALIGSLLNIKPILVLNDGELFPETKIRSHSRAITYLMNKLLSDTEGKEIKAVSISHADSAELAQKLKVRIEKDTRFTSAKISYTTPIISTHTGKGAIGLMYYTQ